MPEITLHFTKERDTKTTTRYKETTETGDPEKIGTIYIKKFALEKLGNPNKITLTLQSGD